MKVDQCRLYAVMCTFLEHWSSRFSLRCSAATPSCGLLLNVVSLKNTLMFGACDLWEIEGGGALSLRHEHKVEKTQSKQEKETKKTYGNRGEGSGEVEWGSERVVDRGAGAVYRPHTGLHGSVSALCDM